MNSDNRHVIHVVPSLDTGGMERVVCDLASHRNGETEVVCLFALGDLGEQLRLRGVRINALRHSRSMMRRVWDLRNFIRHRQPHVVHCHNLQAFTYGSAACLGSKRQVVMTKHGMRMPQRITPGERFRVASAKRASLVGVSNEICQLLGRWSSKPRQEIQLIANGLSIQDFQPSRLDRESPLRQTADQPTIGVIVARLGPEKDHATLLRAAHRIIHASKYEDAHDSVPFKLHVIGDGPCRDDLEQLCAELDLQDNVLFLGERNDIPHQLRQADFAVLSSKTEGTPISLLEAMSAGLPVVATSVGGIPDLVENHRTGLLVQPEDPSALACAIRHVIRAPQHAREMGAAASKRIRAEFSIDRTIEQYESLYASRGCAA